MPFITSLIETYGLLAVFINVFFEDVGIPFPSYPILMLSSALAPGANYNYAEIILTGMVAELLADCGWMIVGRRYGTKAIKLLCRISLTPDSCVSTTNAMFTKIGSVSLTFAKFVPGFSTVSTVMAGTTRIPLYLFLLFDGIGSFFYIGAAVLLGVIFHNAINDIISALAKIGEWGFVIIGTALILYLLRKWIQRQTVMRQLRVDRITVDELTQLINNGTRPVILDVRPKEARLSEGIIPGSHYAHASELKRAITDVALDSEIVVYCSCPDEASAALATYHLRKMGYKKIRPLLGGIDAWSKSGQEVEFPQLAA